MTRDKAPHITISDREPGLPFSKGLMASQVMVSGLPEKIIGGTSIHDGRYVLPRL